MAAALRRAALAVATVVLGSCYSPHPPSGAYLCGVDNACPSSQSCVCGQCVRKLSDAACAFTVDTSAAPPTVNEHQQFLITVNALQQDKTSLASGYNGTVDLSFRLPDGSRWCDVTPSTATLSSGTATLMVSLNRETIPPQTPLLTASGPGGASGATGKVAVTAPPLTKDATAIVDPARAGAAFGWADAVVAEPSVIKVPGEGYRMYFTGAGSGTMGIGVATSTDGKSFTPKSAPALTVMPGTFYSMSVTSAAVYPSSGGGWTMLFAGGNMAFTGDNVNDQLGIATSTDGFSFMAGNGNNPVLRNSMPGPADCNYCQDSLDFPSVLPLPAPADGGTSDSGMLLFFAARQKGSLESIARASLQGTTWVPEPSPVLEGDVGGEALLLAPTVMLDGSVFKMWYSFARLADFKTGQSFCDTPVYIGYATSSDGLYWVRSPSNRNALGATVDGWDAGMPALLAGSAIPLGDDASSGIALYYSVWRKAPVTNLCVAPNGIGRATRP